jgi:asparagine synthase (glutamine-hydrolysing)
MKAQVELSSPSTPSDYSGRSCVLHWDGRLDNRNDLLLLLTDSLRNDTSNAALALAVYDRWGTEGLVRLIGDWSLVIHDDANRSTVLASDFAGVRPLYYSLQSGRILWSNRLQALVQAIGSSELDEEYITSFLLHGGCPKRTPYKGIYSVPPGHAVCASPEATTVHKFWALPTSDEIRYRTQRRYEEHFRTLFREAVSVRLQAESPILAELSGGLDSSSVVSMARHLIRSRSVCARDLATVSYVWRNSLDEPFIHEMESFCGIEGVHISTHDVPLISETQAGNATPEILEPLRISVASAARRLGANVILTGMNGDLMMGNWFDDSLQVAASLRRFRLGQACSQGLAWSKILRLPIYRVIWQAIRAVLPPAVAPAAIYQATDGSYVAHSAETSLRFRNRTDRSGIESCFSDDWMHAPPERRKHFRALSTMLQLRTLQPPEPLQHLDYTHPFAHRPLVEFLMSVPADVLCRPGEPRRLMRSALSDLWPLKLRRRRSKGLFNAPWQEALQTLSRALIEVKELQLVERGFVDRTSLLARLNRLSAGLDCNQSQLRHIIVLELWLRSRADCRRLA